jgi:acetolactate synthase I/III small subunit
MRPVKHTLSVVVQNTPGVLARLAGLISRRGYNIDSFVAAETADPAFYRLTLAVDSEYRSLGEIMSQLDKLVNVVGVVDLDTLEVAELEMALVKLRTDAASRAEAIDIARRFGAKILHSSDDVLILGMSGVPDELTDFLESLKPFTAIESMRTGRMVLSREGLPT